MEDLGAFKELIESSDNILIVTDDKFRIRYSSPACQMIFGFPYGMEGRNFKALLGPDNSGKISIPHGSSASEVPEVIITAASGEKAYFDVRVTNLLNNQYVGGLVFFLHNVTDKKSREFDLIRSNQQLDQVIYKTTHDLKAPLMSALGLVNLAERATESEQKDYIHLIKKSLLKLDSFIEEMNDFFRNEKLALQRDHIEMRKVLTESINDLQNLPEGRRVKVDFDVQGEMEFYSDSFRLKTILTNLLSNALKYSDPKKNEPFIRISVLIDKDFCEISITDNGIGIEPGMQERIFDLFFRATSQSQGTGLGLFIVKDTIQKLKGTIAVKSSLGQGTTFMLRVPNLTDQPIGVE